MKGYIRTTIFSLLLALFICVPAFGATFTAPPVVTSYPYYVILTDTNNNVTNYKICYFKTQPKLYVDGDYLYSHDDVAFKIGNYNPSDNTIGTLTDGQINVANAQNQINHISSIYASSDDVYNADLSTIFFHHPTPSVAQIAGVGNLIPVFGGHLSKILVIGVAILCLILGVSLIPRLVLLFL